MKRVWTGAVVFLSVILMNGCSKCSHDEAVPAPPPGPPPAQDAVPVPPPTDESEELPPGNAAPQPPGTPGAPAPGANESSD